MSFDSRPAIVHVVNSLDGGGTERTLVALLQAWARRDSGRHVVITLRRAGSLAAALPNEVACRALDIEGRSRWSAVRLGTAARSVGAGVIHARNTGTWADAIAARLLCPSSRLVLGFHGLEYATRMTAGTARLARWASRIGARFTTVSDAGRAQLVREAGIADECITTIHNGIDPARFANQDRSPRAEQRALLGIDPQTIVFGTIGSLTPIKQHERLIDAFARLSPQMREPHLVLVGDGPLRRHLLDRVASLGIADRVHLFGWRDDVAGCLAMMDSYVCPSASEGMSNALLEAMAAGLPCIATNVGGNVEVLRDERDGCLVPADSTDAMAEAMASLGASPRHRERLAMAARVRASAFSFDRTVRAYERYYDDQLRRNVSPRTREGAREWPFSTEVR